MFSIINKYNITQIYVSYSLNTFKERVKNKFGLKDYTDKKKPCIFFGVYDKNDINVVNNHLSVSYVMPGGSDINNYKHITEKNVIFISISKDIQKRQ